MKRRTFLQGGFAVVASAAFPGGDGVALESIAHPKYTHETYDVSWTISREALEDAYIDVGARMHAALARSMMLTKENVAARVFWDLDREFLHVEGVTPEEFYVDLPE